MKIIILFLFSILITFTTIAQSSFDLDFKKYEEIEGISKVSLNDNYGISSDATQAVMREDSITGESLLTHYICFSTVENGYLIYLLRLTDIEHNKYIIVDQFSFKSNLKSLYFNTLGCKSIDKSIGNVFAIQGGNSSDNELIKHFFVDDKKDEFKELGPNADYCESNEYMHTIK